MKKMSFLNLIDNKIQQIISKNLISLFQIYSIRQEVYSTFIPFQFFDEL